MYKSIRIESVTLGKNQYHLVFTGYLPGFDFNCKHDFDFVGSDLIAISPLSEKQLDRLRKELAKDFGYPPYNEEDAKKILGDGKQYSIKA